MARLKACLFVSALMAASTLAPGAHATTVTDPANDFISTYTGPHDADLDVVSFSVTYNSSLSSFLLQSTMAGMIDTTKDGFYAIGVNTGTPTSNFGAIMHPGVVFNRVISVQKAGTASIAGVQLTPGSVSVSGNAFSVVVPLSMLPSTGFAPEQYGFNIWPRSASSGGTAVISDFAPEDSTIAAAVPEASTWAMMAMGFGALGATLRRSRGRSLVTA
jgi:hypothetical protein